MTPDNSTQQAEIAYPTDLLPQHLALIENSAISPEVAQERGYRSAKTRKELVELGFQPRQGNVPALVIPMSDVDRKRAGFFIRPDTPRKNEEEREIKYELPKGKRRMLDVPASSHAALSNTSEMLWITDGPRQADALASMGVTSIATLGYCGWHHFRTPQESLPDWDKIKLQGRTVVIAWGSRALATPEGEDELRNFTAFLRDREAVVKYAIPSPGPDGTHLGIDDVIAEDTDPRSLITDARPCRALVPSRAASIDPQLAHASEVVDRFELTPGGICRLVFAEDGKEPRRIQLANFSARIVNEIHVTDGVDEQIELEVETHLEGREKKLVTLTVDEFERMTWPIKRLGAGANVRGGPGVRDELREAIQHFSEGFGRVDVFTHSGWTQVDGRWVYLHAGGAIGPDFQDDCAERANNRALNKPLCEKELGATIPITPISQHRTGRHSIRVRMAPTFQGFRLPDAIEGQPLATGGPRHASVIGDWARSNHAAAAGRRFSRSD